MFLLKFFSCDFYIRDVFKTSFSQKSQIKIFWMHYRLYFPLNDHESEIFFSKLTSIASFWNIIFQILLVLFWWLSKFDLFLKFSSLWYILTKIEKKIKIYVLRTFFRNFWSELFSYIYPHKLLLKKNRLSVDNKFLLKTCEWPG